MGNAELGEKVKAILQQGFQPAEVGLSIRTGIVVWVVSERFESLDDLERQESVWALLEKNLTKDERRSVSIVVALTPDERSFHLAGSL
jgi:acid stress-induced BolA-like protein IbaG/YrbA